MGEQDVRKDVIKRLRTIKGHIQGVEKMVEEGKDCKDVLIQITAIKSSVEKVGLLMIEDNAKACLVKDNITSEEAERVIQEIIKFLK